jgi:hypothetical protein
LTDGIALAKKVMKEETKAVAMFDLVEQWRQSGKSQKQFCEENHIKLWTLLYWVQKYRQSKAPEQGFASLTLAPEPGAGPGANPKIEIELTGGIVVRIY